MPSCPAVLRLRLRPRSLRTTSLLASAFLLCVGAVVVPTAPASAVEFIRTRVPVVAGTELQYPGTSCTAGLVVVRTGVLNNITPAQRAVRYVVTAKHCGAMGTRVSVRGQEVGYVSWVDPVEDLELVRIAPAADGQPTCAPSSQGFHCTGITTFTPQASGRVVLETLRNRAIEAIPVTGTGAPADGEVFCVSGKVTGQSCTWRSAPWQRAYGERTPGEAAATGESLVLGGDSGAPVLSADGRIYGVLEGDVHGLDVAAMIYTRISRFFADAGGYALAPA
jgi:hypothetical protein